MNSTGQTKTVLLNMSNIHAGGGLQAAVSFISELSTMQQDNVDFTYDVILSSAISTELKQQAVVMDALNVDVFDVYGLRAMFSGITKKFKAYDLVFTLFGPGYFLPSRTRHLVGFAQAWIIYPNNEFWLGLPFKEKYLLRLKFVLQAAFFKRANYLVVELEHVKQGLMQTGIQTKENVFVVYNCISSLYFQPKLWKEVGFNLPKDKILIGLVSRDYPHKNIDCLPSVVRLLKQRYSLDVRFVLTLNKGEWSLKSSEFKESVISVGAISAAQCPSFYQKMAAVIFPSFLESFSITPFEALIMEKPLFASDRGFVRDACGEYAYYFDPNNTENIAGVIAGYFLDKSERYSAQAAKQHVMGFSNAASRAENYLQIIDKILKEKTKCTATTPYL